MIQFHPISTLNPVKRRIPGHVDDVMDINFLSHSRILVATPSSDLLVFDLPQMPAQFVENMEPSTLVNCFTLSGHTDSILSISSKKIGDETFIATGSRDRTVRQWKMSAVGEIEATAVMSGHTDHVFCVASGSEIVVSGGEDRVIKCWPLSSRMIPGKSSTARWTVSAHEKAVQTVAISKFDRLIASGSLDRTAKVLVFASIHVLNL